MSGFCLTIALIAPACSSWPGAVSTALKSRPFASAAIFAPAAPSPP